MKLKNETGFPALLLSAALPQHRTQAIVVLKATYEQDATGGLVPAKEQVPIIGDALDTAFGIFHTDHFSRKEGTDLGVLGTVYRGATATELEIRILAGRAGSELGVVGALRVTGDRRWRRDLRGVLRPSAPEPFTEMPLSYARAFGGETVADHERALWPDNPIGVGYYATEAQAEGNPLPNVESARGPLIQSWSDRPRAAGWGPYPFFWGLRATDAVRPRPDAQNDPLGFEVHDRLYNNAHPDMVVPNLEPGDTLRIDGMRDLPIGVTLPREVLVLDAQIGDGGPRAAGVLDGVWLWVDVAKVTLTYRARIEYEFRRGEPRELHVSMQPA